MTHEQTTVKLKEFKFKREEKKAEREAIRVREQSQEAEKMIMTCHQNPELE